MLPVLRTKRRERENAFHKKYLEHCVLRWFELVEKILEVLWTLAPLIPPNIRLASKIAPLYWFVLSTNLPCFITIEPKLHLAAFRKKKQGGQQSSLKRRWKSDLSTIEKVAKKWPILDCSDGANNNYSSNSLVTGIEKSSSYLTEGEFREGTYSALFTSPFSMGSLSLFETSFSLLKLP